MATRNITVTINVENGADVEKLAKELLKQIEGNKPDPLKVGDYVKLLEPKYEMKTGSIVVISEVDLEDDEAPYAVDKVNGEPLGWVRGIGVGVTRASEEDITRAKAELEQEKIEDKWASIGRKVSQYKVGDAVQYKSAFTTVTEAISGRVRIGVKDNNREDIVVQPTDLTLIFPVESRFDR